METETSDPLIAFEPLKKIGWDGGVKLAESGGDDCVVLFNNGKTNPLYKIPSMTPLAPNIAKKIGHPGRKQ